MWEDKKTQTQTKPLILSLLRLYNNNCDIKKIKNQKEERLYEQIDEKS